MLPSLEHLRGRIRGFYALSGPAGLLLTATVFTLVLTAALL
jgi:hypothetical protein